MQPFSPLKTIGEAPVKIASQIQALGEHRLNLTERRLDPPWTDSVGTVRKTIFKDVDRLVEWREALHCPAQALRVSLAVGNLDAAIPLGFVRRHGETAKQSPRAPQVKSRPQADVIVDSDVVAGVL